MAVQLTVEKVLNPGFKRAVGRLAECRTLTEDEHKSVVVLVKRCMSVIEHAHKLKEGGQIDELSEYIAKDIDCQDCVVSSSACLKASLSPADTIALGQLVQGVEAWTVKSSKSQ